MNVEQAQNGEHPDGPENAVSEKKQADAPVLDYATQWDSRVGRLSYIALAAQVIALAVGGYFDRHAQSLPADYLEAETSSLWAACGYAGGFAAAVIVIIQQVLGIHKCRNARRARLPIALLVASIVLVVAAMAFSFGAY